MKAICIIENERFTVINLLLSRKDIHINVLANLITHKPNLLKTFLIILLQVLKSGNKISSTLDGIKCTFSSIIL